MYLSGDEIGIERLNSDALVGVLGIERTREEVHVGLGRRVDGEHWGWDASTSRRVVDDDALSLAQHHWQTDGGHFRA